MGFPSRSPGLTWAVSTMRAGARAGRCREDGLSSPSTSVWRVRGYVTEVTQALRRLFGCRLNGPRIIHIYSIVELILNANRPQLDLLDRFHAGRRMDTWILSDT